MSNDNYMDITCCQSIVADILKIKNHTIRLEFTWKSQQPLDEIISVFDVCEKQLSSKQTKIFLRPSIDEARNSIVLSPMFRIQKHEVLIQKTAPKKIGKTGMMLLVNFVTSFVYVAECESKYFSWIPRSLIFLFLDYLGLPKIMKGKFKKTNMQKINWNVESRIGYDNLEPITSQYVPNTTIILETLMKVYSEQHMKFIDVATCITKDYSNIYFVNPLNYLIWKEFQAKSKIDQLLSENTKINKEMATELIENLDLINDEDDINKLALVSQLVGNTPSGIKIDTLINQEIIPSLFSFFGWKCSDIEINNASLSDNMSLTAKIIRGRNIFIKRKHHQICKVYNVLSRPDFKTYGYGIDLDIFLPGHVQCRIATKSEHQLWMYHLKMM
eukprot:193101_1